MDCTPEKVFLLIIFSIAIGGVNVVESRSQPIDVYRPTTWAQPVLIAHRGGVVTAESSENSAAAVRLAAERGFDMVEVDIQASKDHVPVAFHDDSLFDATGIEARIQDLTLDEIKTIRYQDTGQDILSLSQYLELCAQRDLGVMLDIKADGGAQFFRAIASLIERHQLSRSAITISHHPLAIQHLEEQVMFSVTEQEIEQVKRGEAISLEGKFWFGLPRSITSTMVGQLQRRGALVIPAINVFRYPSQQHMKLAKQAIARMKSAGVDAYQIDAVYAKFFSEENH